MRKYPRTYHLPYSEKLGSDDKKMPNDDHLIGKNVVVTIKMDGENTTIYNDYTHARSLNSLVDSEDRRWVEALRKSKIENNVPDSFRICGENLFYKHTCAYDDLESMFYVFSIDRIAMSYLNPNVVFSVDRISMSTWNHQRF